MVPPTVSVRMLNRTTGAPPGAMMEGLCSPTWAAALGTATLEKALRTQTSFSGTTTSVATVKAASVFVDRTARNREILDEIAGGCACLSRRQESRNATIVLSQRGDLDAPEDRHRGASAADGQAHAIARRGAVDSSRMISAISTVEIARARAAASMPTRLARAAAFFRLTNLPELMNTPRILPPTVRATPSMAPPTRPKPLRASPRLPVRAPPPICGKN